MTADFACDHHLELSGTHCPQPVLHCKAALNKMSRGETLRLVASDPDSMREIPILVSSLGDEMVSARQHGDRYHFVIRRHSYPKRGRHYSLRAQLAKYLASLVLMAHPALSGATK